MRMVLATFLAAAVVPVSAAGPDAVGTYLVYPSPGQPPDAEACRKLLDRTEANEEMARTLLLGDLPQGHPATGASFLILTPDRMESTSLGEGDVEAGSVRFGRSERGLTDFVLLPDSDPGLRLTGAVEIAKDGVVSTITIRGIPIDDAGSTVDRTTHYCRVPAGVPV